jgi:hypothetical protein
MHKLKLLLLFALITLQAFSTKGPYFFSSKTGNIETQISIDDISSFEIEKTALIGKLCDSYIQNSEHKNVFVYIFYLSSPCRLNENSEYFISYDKGEYKFAYSANKTKKGKLLSSEGLIIRISSSNINPRAILKLLEFGLENITAVKKDQKEISWGPWKWKSIDSLTLKSLSNYPTLSNKINTVLASNYEVLSNLTSFNVLWNKEQYKICGKNNQEFLITNNLFLIINLDSTNTLIFDSPKTFFHINSFTKKVSEKQTLIENNDCFRALAIKVDSVIFLTNSFYHNSLVNTVNYDHLNIWRFSDLDYKIENIPFTIKSFYKIFDSVSNQRTRVDIDIETII